MIDIFKIENKPITYINLDDTLTLPTKLGVFDKMYKFEGLWSKSQENSLHEWLSSNCSENFIFIKNTSRLIGGGVSNPKDSFKFKKRFNKDSDIVEYYIKLYRGDIPAFELVWLTDYVYQL